MLVLESPETFWALFGCHVTIKLFSLYLMKYDLKLQTLKMCQNKSFSKQANGRFSEMASWAFFGTFKKWAPDNDLHVQCTFKSAEIGSIPGLRQTLDYKIFPRTCSQLHSELKLHV